MAGDLREVLAAYGLGDCRAVRVDSGLINQTYRVVRDGDAVAILQSLHPIFAPEVNLDIDAITRHLAAQGLDTPRVLRTTDDRLWVARDEKTWRCLSYVEGRTFHRMESAAQAESAGALVGRFHRAVSTLDHEFAFSRAGVHDTARHLAGLRDAAKSAESGDGDQAGNAAIALAAEILSAASELPPLGELPNRLCHGDLKVSNILFAEDDTTARCLIDLDTLGYQTIAFELGDALRSWGNPLGEDVEAPEVRLDIVEAALAGYRSASGDLLGDAEYESIATGLETVCIELAARFCRDVFEDTYFGWHPERSNSRREHNLVRARGQLALGLSVRKQRDALVAAVR